MLARKERGRVVELAVVARSVDAVPMIERRDAAAAPGGTAGGTAGRDALAGRDSRRDAGRDAGA
jgi:hypothetical protein